MSITIPTEFTYCDCSFRYSGAAKSVFDGLEALEGKEVCILANGVVVSPTDAGVYTVVSGGEITLATAANDILVGLPYESVIETLPFDPGDSSVQGKQKKITNLSFKFYETAGRFIQEAQGQTDEFLFESLTTEMKRMLVTDSLNLNGQVKLTLTDPTPCTVLGYYPELEVYE